MASTVYTGVAHWKERGLSVEMGCAITAPCASESAAAHALTKLLIKKHLIDPYWSDCEDFREEDATKEERWQRFAEEWKGREMSLKSLEGICSTHGNTYYNQHWTVTIFKAPLDVSIQPTARLVWLEEEKGEAAADPPAAPAGAAVLKMVREMGLRFGDLLLFPAKRRAVAWTALVTSLDPVLPEVTLHRGGLPVFPPA